MSAPTHYGIAAGQFIPQADFHNWADESGGQRATQTFICLEASLTTDAFANKFQPDVTTALDLDPDLPTRFHDWTLAKSPDSQLMPGGLAMVRCWFRGFAAGGVGGPEAEDPAYDTRGEYVELPITESTIFDGLGEADQSLLRSMMEGSGYHYDGATFQQRAVAADGTEKSVDLETQPSVGDATTLAKLIVKGRKTYVDARIVHTKRWRNKTGIASGDLTNLGDIDTPEGSPHDPSPAAHNWLLAEFSQREQGGVYDNMLRWVRSVGRKFNADIH